MEMISPTSITVTASARQHKCSVGLAYPECHYFGVVHGSYHIAKQHCSQHQRKEPQTHFADREPGRDAEHGQDRDMQRNAIDRRAGHGTL